MQAQTLSDNKAIVLRSEAELWSTAGVRASKAPLTGAGELIENGSLLGNWSSKPPLPLSSDQNEMVTAIPGLGRVRLYT